ncbi:hypothetical protein RvY_07251 [Ramazzottius varieornatus]|uniref:ASX DEUBAD domain-containing protein n=1 Tax=Ramazzottius varieornatus TaxID=947166 RepID=A0A1D1VAW4_RAMVA|nr:hypothetical protein RvY_07251 [Ramazzottius varieornatus]
MNTIPDISVMTQRHGGRPRYSAQPDQQFNSGNDMQYVSILAAPVVVEARLQQKQPDRSSTAHPSGSYISGRPSRRSSMNDHSSKRWKPDSTMNGYSQPSNNLHCYGNSIPSSHSLYSSNGFPTFTSLASSSSADWATSSQPSSSDNDVFYNPVTSSGYFDLKSPIPQLWPPPQSGEPSAQHNTTSIAQDDSFNQLYASVREGMGGSVCVGDQQLPSSKTITDGLSPDSSTFVSPARSQRNLPSIAAFFGPSLLAKEEMEPCSDTSMISIRTKHHKPEKDDKRETDPETSFQRIPNRLTSIVRRNSVSQPPSVTSSSSRQTSVKAKKTPAKKIKLETDKDIFSRLQVKLPEKRAAKQQPKKLKIETRTKASLAGMPSALPEVGTVDVEQVRSPQPLDPLETGFFQKAVASIPPPLTISINGEKVSDLVVTDGEPKKSIRLRIQLSSLRSTVLETVEPEPVHPKLGKKLLVKSVRSSSSASGKDARKEDDVVFVSSTVPDESSTVSAVRVIVPKQVTPPKPKPITPTLGKSSQPGASSAEAFNGTKLTDEMLLNDMKSAASLLSVARLETLDFRAKFDMMPAQVQYEIMNKFPKSFTTVDGTGRMVLKPGTLSKLDGKFKLHLSKWQANLASGEYDPEVRRKYIEYAIKELDPWKLKNFEPVYGEIMRSSASGEEILKEIRARREPIQDGPL